MVKAPVTGKVKGPEVKRQRDVRVFALRSKGWTGERGKAARRRWKC